MAIDISYPPEDVKLPPAVAGDYQKGCLDNDLFQSRGNQEIVDLIDQLLECGINRTISIPQVCWAASPRCLGYPTERDRQMLTRRPNSRL
jgi:hypothetical protein